MHQSPYPTDCPLQWVQECPKKGNANGPDTLLSANRNHFLPLRPLWSVVPGTMINGAWKTCGECGCGYACRRAALSTECAHGWLQVAPPQLLSKPYLLLPAETQPHTLAAPQERSTQLPLEFLAYLAGEAFAVTGSQN